MSSHKSASAVYFSHGGGPLPLLGDGSHAAMVDFMKHLPGIIKKPDSIIVVSAHWEENRTTVLSNPSPPMLYDYFGFPDQAYNIKYPARGNPDLAGRIVSELEKQGITAAEEPDRGFDHGLFIPLKIMYPKADIPSIQLSLIGGLDPAAHLELGKALQLLKNENILLIGSGFSFHNMQAFSWKGGHRADEANNSFQNWLIDTCTGEHTENERLKRLENWEQAPAARYCHPREEHLIPIHICQAFAETAAELVFDDYILGKRSVAFIWH